MAARAFRRFAQTIAAPAFVTRGVAAATSATETLSRRVHGGRTTRLARNTGSTLTLPAAVGSGTRFRLVVGTALSSGQYRINAAGSDKFRGGVHVGDSGDTGSATADLFTAGTTANQINMTLASGGGRVGDVIELEDFAPGFWQVSGTFTDVADPATPFAAV